MCLEVALHIMEAPNNAPKAASWIRLMTSVPMACHGASFQLIPPGTNLNAKKLSGQRLYQTWWLLHKWISLAWAQVLAKLIMIHCKALSIKVPTIKTSILKTKGSFPVSKIDIGMISIQKIADNGPVSQ